MVLYEVLNSTSESASVNAFSKAEARTELALAAFIALRRLPLGEAGPWKRIMSASRGFVGLNGE